MKTVCLLLFVMLISPLAMPAQDVTERIATKITFDGEEKTESLTVRVAPDMDQVRVRVEGVIQGGCVMVYLVDPDGKKTCHFGLNATEGSRAKGSLEEVMGEPEAGIWSLVIESVEAEGDIYLEVDSK